MRTMQSLTQRNTIMKNVIDTTINVDLAPDASLGAEGTIPQGRPYRRGLGNQRTANLRFYIYHNGQIPTTINIQGVAYQDLVEMHETLTELLAHPSFNDDRERLALIEKLGGNN